MHLPKLLPALVCLTTLPSAHAGEVFQIRDGLPSFFAKVATPGDEPVRVSYFGGSITAGAGASDPKFSYRSRLTEWLKKQYPQAKIQPFNAAIGGTGSWLGAYRCWEDVGYQRPDLVIVEFAVNDGGVPESEVLASMEGIVRKLRERTPSKPDILFVYTMTTGQLEEFKRGELPATTRHHEKIAEHYGIPSAAMSRHAADQIIAGKLTPEQFAKDGVHPTDAGYALYLEALKPFFEKSATIRTERKALPKPLVQRPLQDARLVSYDWAELDAGWLGWQLSSTDKIPHLAVSDKPGSTITLKFKGAQAGIYCIIGPDTGNIEYSLDGGEWKHKVLFDKHCLSYARPQAFRLVEGLDAGPERTLRIRIAEDTPEGSKGRFTRLGYFLVDGQVKNPTEGMDPLARIDSIYATMKPVTWQPPADRWTHLEKTKAKLESGPKLNIVMLGDSIIGDTSSSSFEYLLEKDHPKCDVTKIVSVRGSTGCWWYQDDNRVEQYVLRHNPDLLVIGGISQRGDIGAIRSVIHQCRVKFPDLEVLLLSPTFGAPHNPKTGPSEEYKAYQAALPKLAAEEKCGYFDMTTPWKEYIDSSGYALDSFKRDVVHANDRGKQILGRLMQAFFAP
ncbi:MAG: SGNH/GDSL hydrolase family protein [Verrucomicrobiaceae bacterium]|nr:MAG: SGNH/GDSL hydrolase family protein [Verrucomicrobiaceae bacterium]